MIHVRCKARLFGSKNENKLCFWCWDNRTFHVLRGDGNIFLILPTPTPHPPSLRILLFRAFAQLTFSNLLLNRYWFFPHRRRQKKDINFWSKRSVMRRRTYKIELKNFRQIFTGSRFPNAAFKKNKKKNQKFFKLFSFVLFSYFLVVFVFFFLANVFTLYRAPIRSIKTSARSNFLFFFFFIIIFLFLIIEKLIFRLLPLSFIGGGETNWFES